jgi:hypothetical protein
MKCEKERKEKKGMEEGDRLEEKMSSPRQPPVKMAILTKKARATRRDCRLTNRK